MAALDWEWRDGQWVHNERPTANAAHRCIRLCAGCNGDFLTYDTADSFTCPKCQASSET